jgi:hypothetical protein
MSIVVEARDEVRVFRNISGEVSIQVGKDFYGDPCAVGVPAHALRAVAARLIELAEEGEKASA